jgi:P-type E1-E2 ATPase
MAQISLPVKQRSQESKAEASLAALEKMMKNIARVRRDGQAAEIDAEELVPGDIVLMEAGNRVPADGRLFVTATLEIEEAALTGESVASPKNTVRNRSNTAHNSNPSMISRGFWLV